MNEFELPYLYWIPKLHKNQYKHRYITGSSKCSTKPLSLLLMKILTAVKEKLQTYCATTYTCTRSGVNQMWIIKNCKELLANLKPKTYLIKSTKTYDFLTLYTTISHGKLKSRLHDIIDKCFFNKNVKRKYSYLSISYQKHYFVKCNSDSTHKYSELELKKMFVFLIDNIHIVVG
jgi:hypothetical protein